MSDADFLNDIAEWFEVQERTEEARVLREIAERLAVLDADDDDA